MTRVTHRMLGDSALHNLQTNLGRVQALNQQLTSGKTISRPSDDPAGTDTALQVRSDMKALQQYSRNAQDGAAWLSAGEDALSTATTLLNRANVLTLQGLNTGSTSPGAREAMALEVEAIRDDLLATANSSYLGRPVFGGTTSGTTAYDATGTYVGDTGSVQRRLDATTTVRVDTAGPAVFGSGATSVFAVLDGLAASLRANDAPALRTGLTAVQAAFTTVTNAVSDLGARSARTERMEAGAKDRFITMKGQLSQVEDIDLPRTILDLQTQQVAYQASLGATAKVIQPTLMDFLR